jgi:hypothetical protein
VLHVHQQLHPLACGRRDHHIGIFQGEGHRLLDQDVFALLQGEQRMGSMVLVGSCNVDHVHLGVRT